MPPAILCRLVLLTIAALSLTACSSSEDTDPVGPAPVPTPLAITDLNVVGGTAASITLAWTSPQYVDKATIRYDLRYIAFGSESWTGTRGPWRQLPSPILLPARITGTWLPRCPPARPIPSV